MSEKLKIIQEVTVKKILKKNKKMEKEVLSATEDLFNLDFPNINQDMIDIAQEKIITGFMWLNRAVTNPDNENK